jgi:acyl-coenzyme A synthetase/AMP-(fatty) acid ligase/acyl carrier protein
VVRLGGDSVYLNDWELFTQHCSADCVLLNGYGCSEMSSASGFYMDSASQITDSVLPVGYPLGDVGISVVDDQGRTSMVGASADSPSFIGEIVLQSRYLSPGYWQDVAASDASYSAVEGDNGARNYRSKDLATVRGDQGLVHVGRGDAQVKISGFRVEVAEVEACMRNYPGVRDAAAIVRTAGHGERELIGFVGMESRDIECGPDVRSYMLGKLPDHMVPSEIVALADVPCTPNGKIDRSALLKLRDGVWWGRARQAPRTQIEQVVSEIWMQALNIRQIGIEDNFFELGGNSLLGMALIVRIAESFAVQLPALAVFQYPTVRQMAQYIDRLLPTSHGMAESGQVGVEEGVI